MNININKEKKELIKIGLESLLENDSSMALKRKLGKYFISKIPDNVDLSGVKKRLYYNNPEYERGGLFVLVCYRSGEEWCNLQQPDFERFKSIHNIY